MAWTIEHRDGTIEREMSAHQRGLVDTCLEEGQFESAIALMEQLRSPNYKPPMSHLRQLIYIALQPTTPTLPLTVAGQSRGGDSPPCSPSKVSLKNRSRIPSKTAIEAAQRLLISYALTNNPETVAAALPSCDDRRNVDGGVDRDLVESMIGKETMCVQRAKSCWKLLMEGYTARGRGRGNVLGSPGKGKGKDRAAYDSDEEDTGHFDEEEDAVVGEDAWPVLEWLLVLFEQDELLTVGRGLERYSSILLRQIPSPRSGSGKKWDTEDPLRIVFYCLEQTLLNRRMMGSRLMSMLINLSSSAQLDSSLFVASIFTKIAASELDKLPSLFSALGPSPANHRFKLALSQKFLSDTPSREDQAKLQVRAQPRPLRTTRTEPSLEVIKPVSAVGSSKSSLPDYGEIKRLMESEPSSSSSVRIPTSLLQRIKFELVNSYGMLQLEGPPDASWVKALKNGTMKGTWEIAFVEDESGYKEILEAISSTWR